MTECSFCGIEIPRGTGVIFVRKTGKRFDFCTGKCERYLLKLNRSPRNYKWAKEYWKEKGSEVRTEAERKKVVHINAGGKVKKIKGLKKKKEK